MAIQASEELKSKFEKGDLPTQEDFADLIDSCYNNSVSGDVTFFNSITAEDVLFCNNIVLIQNDTKYRLIVTENNILSAVLF
jgi:hypothetical protein